MPEANQTVDPFLTAAVPLPTQGIAFAGVNDAVAITLPLPMAFPGTFPINSLAAPMAVVIPHAAPGQILDIDFLAYVATDVASLGPATIAGVGLTIDDASIAPPETVNPNSGVVALPAAGTFVAFPFRGGIIVKPTWVFPVTITAIYFNDGDAIIGAQGGGSGISSLRVQRVTRERALQLPTLTSV